MFGVTATPSQCQDWCFSTCPLDNPDQQQVYRDAIAQLQHLQQELTDAYQNSPATSAYNASVTLLPATGLFVVPLSLTNQHRPTALKLFITNIQNTLTNFTWTVRTECSSASPQTCRSVS